MAPAFELGPPSAFCANCGRRIPAADRQIARSPFLCAICSRLLAGRDIPIGPG
jgi:hypothetical protein